MVTFRTPKHSFQSKKSIYRIQAENMTHSDLCETNESKYDRTNLYIQYDFCLGVRNLAALPSLGEVMRGKQDIDAIIPKCRKN